MSQVRPTRWLVEGLLAACLGFGVLAALVLLLWTTSAHPGGGVRDALRIAADLWLLAHGVHLLRAETLGGVPAPIGLTPLLLTAIPAWPLYRVARVALCGDAGRWRAVRRLCCGYLLAGAAAVLFTAGAPLSAQPLSAALHLPLFVVAVTGCAALASGTRWRVAAGAARTAAAGTAALCGAGALLFAGGLAGHAQAARAGFEQYGGDGGSGRVAILLLGLALVPNAAVWGAAYGLGPGFSLGVSNAAGPLADAGPAVAWLPPFPLLSAVPSGPPGGLLPWAAVAAVPVAGAVVTAWFAARAAVPVRGSRAVALGPAATALSVLLAAVGTGLAMGALAALAGGALGTRELAEFGPTPWLTSLAATATTATLATPLALITRAWRLRRSRPAAGTVRGASPRRPAEAGGTRRGSWPRARAANVARAGARTGWSVRVWRQRHRPPATGVAGASSRPAEEVARRRGSWRLWRRPRAGGPGWGRPENGPWWPSPDPAEASRRPGGRARPEPAQDTARSSPAPLILPPDP